MTSNVLELARAPGRRTGRPTHAETERLDAHLLDIAERLFLAHGFEGTSMDRLALEARASKRTIYHRYPGKHALFEAVIERALGRVLGTAARAVQGTAVEARLRHMASGLIERALRPDILAVLRVMVAEAGRFSELARSLEGRSCERLITVISDQLRSEVATSGLVLNVPVEIAAEQFMALTQTPLAMRALMGKDLGELRASAGDSVKHAVQAFLHGCCAPQPPGAGDATSGREPRRRQKRP